MQDDKEHEEQQQATILRWSYHVYHKSEPT